jgi:molybdopterin-containing oxidoreductase family iron-sulfur binding subunit
MTKLTWDNAAILSPATAREFGVRSGDVIRIARDGRSVELPVWIQPGHADGSIALELGYGRTSVGRVGEGTGVNVAPLRTAAAMGFAGGVEVTKTGRRYELASAQEHHSMEGRALVREATLEHYREEPEFAQHAVHHPPLESLYENPALTSEYQWGMAIDLNKCTGCNACVVACQAENNIPIVGKHEVARGREMHWIRLDRYFTGSEEDPQAVLQPVACQQCENAPCENVCPVAATSHSDDGLNMMTYNRCVGTRYCSNNCPYKVRRFNFLDWHGQMAETEKMVFNPDVTVRMRGVMEKCTYCVQRIQEKKIQAKAEGRRSIEDGEVVPACQQTCASEAIVFGNIADPESKVSRVKAQNRNYAMLAELNIKPRTSYLARIRNPNPEIEGPADDHGDHASMSPFPILNGVKGA